MQTVYNDLVRPSADVVKGFQELLAEYSPSCLVTDAQKRMNAIGGLLPVVPSHKIAGPALTINLDVDDLVDCMPVLTRAQPGDVIVLACHGTVLTAMWGGLMSTLSIRAGIEGAIVDGPIRDVDEIRDLGFPIWYEGTIPRPSPSAGHHRIEPVQVNVPVVVRGQVINPGDILVADENGIAVVPAQQAEQVLQGAQARNAEEKAIREKISSGTPLAELLAKFGHL
jgi:4-hydroxy-4-methyl-2-oxoglutarate aldolase